MMFSQTVVIADLALLMTASNYLIIKKANLVGPSSTFIKFLFKLIPLLLLIQNVFSNPSVLGKNVVLINNALNHSWLHLFGLRASFGMLSDFSAHSFCFILMSLPSLAENPTHFTDISLFAVIAKNVTIKCLLNLHLHTASTEVQLRKYGLLQVDNQLKA